MKINRAIQVLIDEGMKDPTAIWREAQSRWPHMHFVWNYCLRIVKSKLPSN
jgi:hypothetical protein